MRIERTDIRDLGSLYLEEVAGKNIDMLDEESPYMGSRRQYAGEEQVNREPVEQPVQNNRQSKYFEIVNKYISKLSTELVNADLMGEQEAENLGVALYTVASEKDPFRWEDDLGEENPENF